MSLSVEGKQCQVCKAYLFDDDDVVFCPDCGAPYHRDCYNQIGHCVLEHLHGTEEQYCEATAEEPQLEENKEENEASNTDGNTVKCKMCNTEYESELTRCPDCGAPNFSKMGGGYAVFDFLGGVPSDTDLGDGVTADEAKKFVFFNSYRYIPKFLKMKLGKKASWNWLAFLLPGPWMLSRKMYGLGALFSTLTLISDLFALNFNRVLYENLDTGSFSEIYQYIYENFASFEFSGIFILALVGSLIAVITHIVSGIFGDYFYRNHTISGVKKIKQATDTDDNIWRKKGGISLVAMFIGLFVFVYLPEIVGAFLL